MSVAAWMETAKIVAPNRSPRTSPNCAGRPRDPGRSAIQYCGIDRPHSPGSGPVPGPIRRAAAADIPRPGAGLESQMDSGQNERRAADRRRCDTGTAVTSIGEEEDG